MVVISIKINGKGIDLEIIPKDYFQSSIKIFSRNRIRIDISNNIIEAHGGPIWAENNSDDKGATFAFRLFWQLNKINISMVK